MLPADAGLPSELSLLDALAEHSTHASPRTCSVMFDKLAQYPKRKNSTSGLLVKHPTTQSTALYEEPTRGPNSVGGRARGSGGSRAG